MRSSRYLLVRHGGLSYLDWTMMTHWQKMDYLARFQEEKEEEKKRMDKQKAEMKARMGRLRGRTFRRRSYR